MKSPRRIAVIAASVAVCLVVVLISLLLYGAHSGANVPSFQQRFAQLGGTQVVLAEPAGAATSASVAANIHAIEQRLSTAAAIRSSNVLVYSDTANHLVVDTAGVQVVDQTITDLLTTTGQVDVIDTGSQLDPSSIQASIDPVSNRPVVLFEFQPASQGANLAAEVKYGALSVPLVVIHQTTFQAGTPAPVPSSP